MIKPRIEVKRPVKPIAKKTIQRAPGQTTILEGIFAAAGVGKHHLRQIQPGAWKNALRRPRPTTIATRGLQARTAARPNAKAANNSRRPIKTIPKTGELRTRQALRTRPKH
ncbi:MAG: hypothetical protein Q7R70_03540 [Candidatus Diapherotrites archaeon]|nr:hypothetical protein [Candidatus Diapherotrites archaeon]